MLCLVLAALRELVAHVLQGACPATFNKILALTLYRAAAEIPMPTIEEEIERGVATAIVHSLNAVQQRYGMSQTISMDCGGKATNKDNLYSLKLDLESVAGLTGREAANALGRVLDQSCRAGHIDLTQSLVIDAKAVSKLQEKGAPRKMLENALRAEVNRVRPQAAQSSSADVTNLVDATTKNLVKLTQGIYKTNIQEQSLIISGSSKVSYISMTQAIKTVENSVASILAKDITLVALAFEKDAMPLAPIVDNIQLWSSIIVIFLTVVTFGFWSFWSFKRSPS